MNRNFKEKAIKSMAIMMAAASMAGTLAVPAFAAPTKGNTSSEKVTYYKDNGTDEDVNSETSMLFDVTDGAYGGTVNKATKVEVEQGASVSVKVPFKIVLDGTKGAENDATYQVTVKGDARVTKVGRFVRKSRLDEVSQLIDVFRGTMTFVGTRPEVPKYTERYTPEMMATLLLPAGVTSLASIYYKDEAELLDASDDTDKTYVEKVLPEKMRYNLKALEDFSFFGDIKIMFKTVFAMLGRVSENENE